jgi:hypothetical protein
MIEIEDDPFDNVMDTHKQLMAVPPEPQLWDQEHDDKPHVWTGSPDIEGIDHIEDASKSSGEDDDGRKKDIFNFTH